ncbi:MAG: LacI family DNA-binding transcriptional regulator [Sphingopyxis sp.]
MSDAPRVRNITELARLAGVSAGTVSRALADSQLISKKTRDHVQKLAREYDFRPNVMARNLRIKRAGAIGVVIPLGHETGQHISDPFFMTLLGHLADALTERGHDLVLSRVIPDSPDWLSKIVDSGRVDGAIIIGQSNQSAVIDDVAARYLPMVVWGASHADQTHCSVGTDNRLGGALSAQHLIAAGCRRIAFFGEPSAPEIADRLDGCRDAVVAAGLADGFITLPVHLTADTAHPAISTWLAQTPIVPDGIVAASDVIAMAALRALSERGFQVPGDIRIVGYDDLPFAAQTLPPLSTIRQDLVAGAAHLVDLLFRRISGERTESVVLAPGMIVRESA